MNRYLSKEEYIAKYYNEPKQELLTDLYYKTRDNILLQQENEQLKNILEELEQYCLDKQIFTEYPNYNQLIKNMAYDDILNRIQKLKEKHK